MIIFKEQCQSTQTELIALIKSGELTAPSALLAKSQSAGIGSRGNGWSGGEGNLFLSFALRDEDAPADMPPVSASVWFGLCFVEFLRALGSAVWLKWPNDIYLNDKKVGGVITAKLAKCFVCGIGANLASAPDEAAILDIKIDAKTCATQFLRGFELAQEPWEHIIAKIASEFEKSRAFSVHVDGVKTSLKDAVLLADGSVQIAGKRIFSNR